MKDLTGLQFGRLKVMALSAIKAPSGAIKYVCECECGSTLNVIGANLTRKTKPIQSCGCLHRESVAAMGKANRTHGLSLTPEAICYWAMVRRCTVEDDESYSRYGGRGIRVCDRWMESIENFLEDMGSRPSKAHSIERRDNEGNYDPDNCYWATREVQNTNRRTIRWFTINGEKKYLAEIAREHGIKISTLGKRLTHYGKTIEEAIAMG